MNEPHGGNRRAAAERYGRPAESFLDFSANICPLPYPSALAQRLAETLPRLREYPAPEHRALTARLAAIYGCDPGTIVIGNGTAELVFALLRAFPASRVVTCDPTFTEYAQAAHAASRPHLSVPRTAADGFALPAAALAGCLQEGDLLFLGQPDNPTGTCLAEAELADVRALCRKRRAMLVLDEAFVDYTDTPSLVGQADDTLIVLRALTKILAIPGLRVGFLTTAPALAARLRELLPPWNINVCAEVAVDTLLTRTWVDAAVAANTAARAELARGLAALPLRVFPSQANFLLVRRADGGSVAALADTLGRQGILIRTCTNFAGLDDAYLRVAVRTPDDNAQLLDALRAAL